jgi:transposase-like protein
MGKQEFAIPALAAQLQTEADAYRLLEELRWNGHPSTCPHCGGIGRCYFLRPRDGVSRRTRTGSRSERRVWRCGHCRRSFSVLVGTVLHGTKVPIRIWSLVVVALCASDNGVAAAQIKRDYGLTAKTARFMLHRIRQAMQRDLWRCCWAAPSLGSSRASAVTNTTGTVATPVAAAGPARPRWRRWQTGRPTRSAPALSLR